MATQPTKTPTKWGRRILKIAFFAILVLALITGVGGYVLLGVSPVPEASNYEIDLLQIRQLALGGEEPLPIRLNAMIVAEGAYPEIMVIAGGRFQSQRMSFSTFQVVYADQTAVIDATLAKSDYETMFPGGSYDTDKFDLLQSALRASGLILATHEHFDHIGGLAKSPYLDEIRDRTALTREQIENAGPETGFTTEELARHTPLDYDRYHRVAPGMVLIKAPGHTPGGQMVYIQLQNGVEYLLVGDIVWNSKNIEQLTGRPLLIGFMEDRQATASEIRSLYTIMQTEIIHLIVSHDGEQIEAYMQEGILGETFE